MKENLDHPANAATAVGAQPGFVIVIQHADGKQETVGPPPQQPALIDVTPIEEPRRPLQREL
jgi:hypothetical protein